MGLPQLDVEEEARRKEEEAAKQPLQEPLEHHQHALKSRKLQVLSPDNALIRYCTLLSTRYLRLVQPLWSLSRF